MTFWQDLRTAARMLRRHPAFTLGAVVTVSLGITGTISVLALCKPAFFAPPFVFEPDRIVRLFLLDPQVSGRKFSFTDYEQLQGRSDVFTAIAAYSAVDVELRAGAPAGTAASHPGDIRRAVAHSVSANYFSTLGVQMRLGRAFQPDEDGRDSDAGVVISSSLWRYLYGSDPAVLGRNIAVNGHALTVIGVAPPGFQGIDPTGPDLWVPYLFPLEARAGPEPSGDLRWLYLLGRLKPGLTATQAEAALSLVARNWSVDHPERSDAQILVTTISAINSENRGRIVPLVTLMVVAVGFVLLIACANVANLLLARGVSRQREISTRLALGASRFQVTRQLVAEGVLLSLLGAGGGALLAQWTTPLLYLAVTNTAGRAPADLNIDVDGWVIAATAVVSLCTAVLFSLPPALQATRSNLVSALRVDGSAVHHRLTASRMRSVLVVGQVALSLVLLTGAGLFTRALARSESFDLGFDAHNLLVISADLRGHGSDESRARIFYARGEERFASLPDVRSVSLARVVPASDLYLGDIVSIAGEESAAGDTRRLVTYYDLVSPNYFASLKIPVVRGRVFSKRETDVVVVNEAFVRRFLSGAEPVGRRIRLGGDSAAWAEIVGVVKDTMHGRPGERAFPLVYRQLAAPYPGDLSFLVRTTGNPQKMRAVLATEIRTIDPNLVFSIRTMDENVRSIMWPARIGVLLSAVLGFVAVTLAAVGLFGVMAYTVNQRTREVGIRMALGASASSVMRWVLWQASGMVCAGLMIGLVVAAVFSRALSSFLFGLSPWDPVAFAGCAMLLTGIALVASYLPARRAMRVDLTTALRQE